MSGGDKTWPRGAERRAKRPAEEHYRDAAAVEWRRTVDWLWCMWQSSPVIISLLTLAACFPLSRFSPSTPLSTYIVCSVRVSCARLLLCIWCAWSVYSERGMAVLVVMVVVVVTNAVMGRVRETRARIHQRGQRARQLHTAQPVVARELLAGDMSNTQSASDERLLLLPVTGKIDR